MPLLRSAKSALRASFRRLGYDIVPAQRRPDAMLRAFMQTQRIARVVDVGANTGQFARSLRAGEFEGPIYCFEPLSAAHDALTRWAAGDAAVTVFPRAAVGSARGRTTINISDNSVSSSLLAIQDQHTDAAPSSAYRASEPVEVVTLDDHRAQFDVPGERLLLKIDTQGFEAPVLDGGPETLAGCHAVYVELSLTPLYEGQALWDEIAQRLLSQGFALWSLAPNFFDERTGRVLQADGLFVRAEAQSDVPPVDRLEQG